jgi:hypothetical protein
VTAPTPDPTPYREDLFPGLTALVDDGYQVTFLLVNNMYVAMVQRGDDTCCGVGTSVLGAFNHLHQMMETPR